MPESKRPAPHEAGKGFAVVAQEVRELAQRSAQAAKEIKGLIRNSSEEVSTGVKLVSETGEALRTIQQNIVAVNDHMEAITSSAKEQATGLSEVNSAVNQMDQVTQQNAAMVEETNAASATLAQETARLRDLIEMFQLGGTASRASLRGANHSSDNTSNRKLELAQPGHRPVPSPARQLITSMTGRVSGGAVPDNWQEF